MKNRIPELIFIISVLVFVYMLIFLKPIESIKPVDNDTITEYVFQDFDTIGLEGKEQIIEKYNGSITLDRVWVKIKLIFSIYAPEISSTQFNEEEYFSTNIDKIYEEFGINNIDEFKDLVNSFKIITSADMASAVLVDNSINILEDGVSFKMIVKNVNGIEQKYDFLIYNNEKEGNVMYKILSSKEEVN